MRERKESAETGLPNERLECSEGSEECRELRVYSRYEGSRNRKFKDCREDGYPRAAPDDEEINMRELFAFAHMYPCDQEDYDARADTEDCR